MSLLREPTGDAPQHVRTGSSRTRGLFLRRGPRQGGAAAVHMMRLEKKRGAGRDDQPAPGGALSGPTELYGDGIESGRLDSNVSFALRMVQA